MRFPRGEDVPVTSRLGGLVFVLTLFAVSTPVYEGVIYGTWGAIYGVECLVRRRRGWPVRPAPRPAP